MKSRKKSSPKRRSTRKSSPKKLKLISIKPSSRPDKKLVATFSDGTKTHFGAKGMSDFTIHKDKARRERYRNRHRKDLLTNDPRKAGYLSWYILWGDYPDLKKSIQIYKKKFNL